MPTYEFKCDQCNLIIHEMRSMVDHTKPACSECGSEMRKHYSPITVTFNGPGFYQNDKHSGANR